MMLSGSRDDMLQITSEHPSFDSLESFLEFFKFNKFDLNCTFTLDSKDDLYNFLLKYSAPSQSETLAFLKSALILLLLHPLILKRNTFRQKSGSIRSVLLQIIGRCVRRSNRAQIKTLPITVPMLLPHLTDPNLFKMIIEDLHLDLQERFKKYPDPSQLYNDPLTLNLLIVFDFLYLVNESFWTICYDGRVEPALFYHPFPDGFQICEDYAHWRDLSEITDRNLPFAFCDYPWIFDLDCKRTLLTASNGLKQRHHLQDTFFRAIFDGVQTTSLNLSVRRGENLLKDARDQLLGLPGHQLAKQLRVTFKEEEGIDEGGLRKEFFQLCWDELFPTNNDDDYKTKDHYKLFTPLQHDNSMFWFNDAELNDMDQYAFVGLLLALAIYNGVLVAPRFPLLLFKKLLNWPLQFDDYIEIDPVLVRSVNKISSDPGMIFELYHVVPGENSEEKELIPGGSSIPVTPHNFSGYLERLTDYLLNSSVQDQFEAFKTGFESVTSGSVIYGYRPDELFALAYGSDQFDIADLKIICNYEGGYRRESLQICWLWEVLETELSKEMQSEFLAFVTGSARAPLGGLTRLKSFTVTRNTVDSDRLPSAHTCFNTLLLPEYPTRAKLKEKLLIAIQHNRGFGLI